MLISAAGSCSVSAALRGGATVLQPRAPPEAFEERRTGIDRLVRFLNQLCELGPHAVDLGQVISQKTRARFSIAR
jgi:hypothetical protein